MAHRFSKEELVHARSGFSLSLRARFQDVDAAGIVFFPRVLEYCHDAYLAFLETSGFHLPDLLRDHVWAAPLKHAEADYLHPIRFGDALDVALVQARIEGSVLTVGYRITGGPVPKTKAGTLVAVAQTVHVFVDATTFQRVAMPPALVAAFNRIGEA